MDNSLLELYWAAGFFDGEGSTGAYYATPSSSILSVRMSIHQVAREPLERFQQAVGGYGGIGGPYNNGSNQPIHRYQVTKIDDVRHVAKILAPVVCTPKRQQMDEAIRASDASRIALGFALSVSEDTCKRGHGIAFRKPSGQCRMCMRITDAKRHNYLTPEWIASWELEGGVPYTGWLRTKVVRS